MLGWFFTPGERWAHWGFSISGGFDYGVHDVMVAVVVFFFILVSVDCCVLELCLAYDFQLVKYFSLSNTAR